MSKQVKSLLMWFCAGCLLFVLFARLNPQTMEMTPKQLESAIESGQVKDLSFDPNTFEITGTLAPAEKGALSRELSTRAIGSTQMDEIRKDAETHDVSCVAQKVPSAFLTMIIEMAPFAVLIFLWIWMMKGQVKDVNKFVSRGGKRFTVAKDNMDRKTFADVAGCEEAKEEVADIVEFLRNPKVFSSLGGKVPRGVLLNGVPGTGKTLLAKAVAGEAGVPFLSAKGSEFIEMFVGVGASRMRALFDEARASAPCIVFIDEIDAIGKKRGVAIGGGHDEREQTLNQLLVELDGFEKTRIPIVVIAATNRLDVLDEALVRPGRFDREVEVPRPDVMGREAILKVHAIGKKFAASVNFVEIARDTAGMVGADLENVLNEAALSASKQRKVEIDQADLHEAVDKVSMGKARRSMKLSDKEKKLTAYHEGGHTLVAKLIPGSDPVHKVTIIPRGPALGFTKQLPEEDKHSYSKKYLLGRLRILAGGKIAEELVFSPEEVTTGASSDFDRATQIARRMVYEFGMTSAGSVVYKDNSDFWGRSTGTDISPANKEKLENEVKKLLDDAIADVRNMLQENRAKLDALAKALLEKETLHAAEIDAAINSI
ncbi:ATP-dependent zinc metalloprotease FtsH [Patescibacteria group bacterium]|nr:ATP-dependent zinc metalloprotease FtsH [Patescibacteria group bacterium]